MLVILPHGTCVDPDIVKYITVRIERPNPNAPAAFAVILKTDVDENFIILGKFDNHNEAQALAVECATLINNDGNDDSDSDSESFELNDDDTADDEPAADDDW